MIALAMCSCLAGLAASAQAPEYSDAEARRVLTNEVRSNRLACVLAEFAQTNDARIAEWAMWQLEKYATPAQLPFLYSCAQEFH